MYIVDIDDYQKKENFDLLVNQDEKKGKVPKLKLDIQMDLMGWHIHAMVSWPPPPLDHVWLLL